VAASSHKAAAAGKAAACGSNGSSCSCRLASAVQCCVEGAKQQQAACICLRNMTYAAQLSSSLTSPCSPATASLLFCADGFVKGKWFFLSFVFYIFLF
jgi:hypothetical protein